MEAADLGRRAPSEARLQLARRPLITGVASSQAFFAASGSLNVTYIYPTPPKPTLANEPNQNKERALSPSKRGRTYETVALGSAGELVGDDDGLQDLSVLLEMVSHGLLGGLPGEAANKHFGKRGVAELPDGVAHHHVQRCTHLSSS